ncbi:hypothetical protein ACQ4M4_26310 [Leptolyngbya sp. AN02str]|uniref:hypothetical protein n=1 Tax=Leptolyngbya sp. AN02str TaxID=3423363 RepID=UPI003D31637D
MSYSLLSRFRGAIAGVVLGQYLGTRCETEGWQRPEVAPDLRMRSLADVLLQQDGVEVLAGLQTLALGGVEETAIALVPLALYWHDAPSALQASVTYLAQQGNWLDEVHDSTLIVVTYLAQLLRDGDRPGPPSLTKRPQQHLASMVDEIRPQLCQPTIEKQLQSLLISLQQGHSQAIAFPASSDSGVLEATLIALYGMASTPADPGITYRRAVQTSTSPTLTGAIAGALSGSWNGIAGVRSLWHQHLGASSQSAGASSQSAYAIDPWLTLADRLFALWCGLYDPTHELSLSDMAPLAIAVPSATGLVHAARMSKP